MSLLCIQIQPDRAPELDIKLVRGMLAEFLSDGVGRKCAESGSAGEGCLRFTVEVDSLAEAWRVLWVRLYEDPQVGPSLQQATIVVGEGHAGSRDYSLLHHFDGLD